MFLRNWLYKIIRVCWTLSEDLL